MEQRSQRDCGVSVTWLRAFCEANTSAAEDLTTQQVADRVILHETQHQQCRYVDLLDSKHVGPVTYFVSHRWQASFRDLVRLVDNYCSTLHSSRLELNPDKTFLWIDLFAVNQHSPAADLAAIKDVIACSVQTLLCIDRDQQVLTRVWCVYEVWRTLQKPRYKRQSRNADLATPLKQLQVLFPMTANVSNAIAEMWRDLDITQARASKEADRDAIFRDILEVAPPLMINQQVRSALLEPQLVQTPGKVQSDFRLHRWGLETSRPDGTSWLYPPSHPELAELGQMFSKAAGAAMTEWEQQRNQQQQQQQQQQQWQQQ